MSEAMTPKERVRAAINMEEPDRVPCSIMFDCFVARQAGVTIEEYMNNLKLHTDLDHECFEKLEGIDAVQQLPLGLFGDLADSLVYMPMKVKLPGKDIDPNSIVQYQEFELMTADGYDKLLEKGWERYVKEELVPRAYPDYTDQSISSSPSNEGYDPESDRHFYEEKNVFIYTGVPMIVPFDLFSFARSIEKFAVDLYRHPEKVIAAMDAIMPRMMDETLSAIKDTPSPVLYALSRSSNGFISPKQFEKFVLPYMKMAIEAIVSNGSPIYFHLDQSWTKFLPYFRDEFPEGNYVLHFDGATDIFKAKEIIGDRMCIMGDVPAPLFVVKGPEDVKDYCKKLIDAIGKGGGFILAAGCTVPDNAKFENIKAMVDTANTYYPSRH